MAADDWRCSKIGASVLRRGGHAVDAAVATALCLGVVNPLASGIGGGSFMLVRSSLTSKVIAYNMRETAPLSASQVSKHCLFTPVSKNKFLVLFLMWKLNRACMERTRN